MFTDGFKTYDSLIDLGYKKHYRVYHGKNEFAKKEQKGKKKIKNHINGIENFWGIDKVRLYKFRGMDKKHSFYILKNMNLDLIIDTIIYILLLLKMCRNNPFKSIMNLLFY